MSKKYELTDECKSVFGRKLFRIRAVRYIPAFNVRVGDLGGWVEAERNLSHDGDAWVSDNAEVCGYAWAFGNAWVSGNAKVFGSARVFDNAKICGNAWVSGNANVCGYAEICGDAKVFGNADYMTFKNSWSIVQWFTYTRSNKMWKADCFHGTGEELIKDAYVTSELSGRCYEAVVRAVKQIEAAKAELMQQDQNKQGGRND